MRASPFLLTCVWFSLAACSGDNKTAFDAGTGSGHPDASLGTADGGQADAAGGGSADAGVPPDAGLHADAGGPADANASSTCNGVVCDSPPPTACYDGYTLGVFETTGTCDQGQCAYREQLIPCAQGCAGAACLADPCSGISCTTPPASTCVAGALRVWSPTGTCSGGTCSYGYVDDACPNGCSGNACIGDACGGTTCDRPPADTCQDVSNAVVHSPLGTCDGNSCSYQSTIWTCSKGCLNGACVAGSWSYETNPLTNGTIPYDGLARLVLDAASRPREVVCDEDGNLDYNERTLHGWQQTIVASGLDNGCVKALALAPDGRVYIAYGDPVNNYLRFADRAPGATAFGQSIVTTDPYTNGAVSITVDDAGDPVVAYSDGGHQKVRVATRKSGQWTFEDATTGAGSTTVIRFDGHGDLHLIVGAGSVNENQFSLAPIYHAVRSNGVWSSSTLAPGGVIGARSLGITAGGLAYFLYAAMPSQYQLDLVTSIPGLAVETSLTDSPLDPASIPVVAFDWFGDDLRVARAGGTIAGPETVPWAARQNGAWTPFMPDLDYEICDGEVGADGRGQFLMSQSWVLLQAPACVPQCSGRTCGSDGCGGTCGSCPAGACSPAGMCQ